jgi:hypothetical protein
MDLDQVFHWCIYYVAGSIFEDNVGLVRAIGFAVADIYWNYVA